MTLRQEPPEQSKYTVLKTCFGYDAFREGQEELIDALSAGRDVLGVMPTGAGKSVCYQVPALLKPGVALVVSPLISLMKDQVAALKAAGVPAAYLNSSLTPGQQREALRRAALGTYRVVYVAPERLEMSEFVAFARAARLSLVAVDEAHCVSHWGQDFRPSYLKIAEFIDRLPVRPPVGAFTATATPQVKADVVRLLRLREPLIRVTGFDRPNLRFRNRKPKDKFAALMEIVHGHAGECGIVYCATRKTVEEVCQRLQAERVEATRYHAGLPDEERARNQDAFQYDRAAVIVATNAFGMGIDKSNVSYVVHYNMPKCLESYYQEAGRAGRDGSPAECVLLYNGQDVMTARWMVEHADPSPELTADEQEELRRRELERLRLMTAYSTSRRCLRQFLLQYFGEKAADRCDNCSVCLGEPFEEVRASQPEEARPSARRGHAAEESPLYQTLRAVRLRLATERHVPAYVILTDATLHALVARRPHTWEELLDTPGMGAARRDRYGDTLLGALCAHDGVAYLPQGTGERPEHSHAGKPWSTDEDERLRDAFEREVGIGALCIAHGRSAYAIRARLRRLGLTE